MEAKLSFNQNSQYVMFSVTGRLKFAIKLFLFGPTLLTTTHPTYFHEYSVTCNYWQQMFANKFYFSIIIVFISIVFMKKE